MNPKLKWKPIKQLDIVGTAEAADILGVERPRIGRWIKRGVMPPTASELKATPVWHRKHIERMKPWVEAHRRTAKLPIDSYLWHKGGGGQFYAKLSKLGPGEHFTDKSGTEFVVVLSGARTKARMVATGATVLIPHAFVNGKGEVKPTRVNVG